MDNLPTNSEPLEVIEGQLQDGNKPDLTAARFYEIYDQINSSNDIAEMTAAYLTMTNYYNYGLTKSNEINGRQGKNRVTITHGTAQLMEYSTTTDTDTYLEKRLNELTILMLNQYLSDKQTLPTNNSKTAVALMVRAKALFIMLFYSNNYGLIDKLNIPSYLTDCIDKAFDVLEEIKEEALQSFIKYLENSDNYKMADIVRQLGNEFWGGDQTDAIDVYNRWFKSILDQINKPKETYEAYLDFRSLYRKSTKNIIPSVIYDVFEITANSYSRARANVIGELSVLFTNEDNKAVIQSLLNL